MYIFNRYDMNDTSTPKQDEIKGYVHIWTQFPQLHVDKTPGWGGGDSKGGLLAKAFISKPSTNKKRMTKSNSEQEGFDILRILGF